MSFSLKEICELVNVRYDRALEGSVRDEEDSPSISSKDSDIASSEDSLDDYIPDRENTDEQSENDDCNPGTSADDDAVRRKRRANPSRWKANVQKKRRMMGQSYRGRRGNGSIIKEARKMGERCQSASCQKSKQIQCCEIDEGRMKDIFKYFWEKLDWKERRMYVKTMVEVNGVKRRRTEAVTSRRSASLFCFLCVDGKRIRVCQRMFLSTLGIRQWTFLKWVGRRGDSPKKTERACSDNSIRALSRQVFTVAFNQLNLSLFHPKKDQCDTCCAFKAGNIEAALWEKHRKKKDDAREEKENDKQLATNTCLVTCMDLQSLLLCPKLQVSALYYKMKLGVHNLQHGITCSKKLPVA
ncbi:uncharacterized protein LOC121705312 isoform X2 [Alosa sapidissima]|uniref:uncharacterized protein LOC121705312 isoform X2 n=1 Tax=Alosa sapidissima TaxID=34773 RepID=UPI001C0A4045|nr:uncharacterized protein LOC121705312 isoform X2 [Alosa sapidissima]